MNDFIAQVTSQLGIGESEGRSATGSLLSMIKEQMDDSAFGKIVEKLPGADSLMDDAGSSGGDAGGGGLLGSLAGAAGSLLGAEGSGVGNVIKILSDSGISVDKASGFLSAFVAFLKDKLGDDLFATVASSLPGLLGNDDS